MLKLSARQTDWVFQLLVCDFQ